MKTGEQDTIMNYICNGVFLAYSWRKQKKTPTKRIVSV
jgi:hypothetical protein